MLSSIKMSVPAVATNNVLPSLQASNTPWSTASTRTPLSNLPSPVSFTQGGNIDDSQQHTHTRHSVNPHYSPHLRQLSGRGHNGVYDDTGARRHTVQHRAGLVNSNGLYMGSSTAAQPYAGESITGGGCGSAVHNMASLWADSQQHPLQQQMNGSRMSNHQQHQQYMHNMGGVNYGHSPQLAQGSYYYNTQLQPQQQAMHSVTAPIHTN
eukprot:Lankesteria_metandrocarpae@DN7788_c0_g1_i1.p1